MSSRIQWYRVATKSGAGAWPWQLETRRQQEPVLYAKYDIKQITFDTWFQSKYRYRVIPVGIGDSQITSVLEWIHGLMHLVSTHLGGMAHPKLQNTNLLQSRT